MLACLIQSDTELPTYVGAHLDSEGIAAPPGVGVDRLVPGAHTDGAPGTTLHTAAAQADETSLLTWQLAHDGGCVVRHTISNSIVCH